MKEAQVSNDLVKQAFGEVVTHQRTACGYTQRTFSRLVGISNSHLRSIESGAVSPTLVTLFKIAHALGQDPAKLVAEATERASALAPEQNSDSESEPQEQ